MVDEFWFCNLLGSGRVNDRELCRVISPDLGSRRTGHIQFGRRPLRRLHCVSAEREGTREVHGKMDLSKHMLFQSVRLVGAVGIEPTTLGLKGLCSTTELRPYSAGEIL
jgi:hypothetical protein